MLRASTAHSSLSRTGDTNRGNFLLNLVANRSIWGVCHWWQFRLYIPLLRDHSVWITWLLCDSLSAITFNRLGIWRAGRAMFLRLHHDRSLQRKAQGEPDFIPPLCLCRQQQLCCLAIRTVWSLQRCSKRFRVHRTAYNSRKLMCSLLSGTNHRSLAVKSPR